MAPMLDRLMLTLGVKKQDPVCGMAIRPSDAVATSESQRKTIYFCATGCKEDFDANPSAYL